MRKNFAVLLCLFAVAACSKHDPILPGLRTPVFDSNNNQVLNQPIDNLSVAIAQMSNTECPYTQDSTNVIKDARGRKIFSGFPTNNSVRSNAHPVCSGKYVYAGLTTGEVVKVDTKSREVIWIADIFRTSNMTGGASVVDIVAPIALVGGDVYAGGLGDAYCRLNAKTGAKKWCTNISVAYPFIITDVASFVVASDSNLYAVRNSDGAIYWRAPVKKPSAPSYENEIITVGRQQINAKTGEIIK